MLGTMIYIYREHFFMKIDHFKQHKKVSGKDMRSKRLDLTGFTARPSGQFFILPKDKIGQKPKDVCGLPLLPR